jgi:hypothetical protein
VDLYSCPFQQTLHYSFAMADDLTQTNTPMPEHEAVKDVRLHRTFGDEEFKSKLEMTKAFCDTAKSYVQMSSAGLALPFLFVEIVLGKTQSETGLGYLPLPLLASWVLFLLSIGCGLIYQWLAMRRLWDQYHMGHRTVENMAEPGYRVTKGIVKTNGINLSWVWLGMMFGFFFGAFFFAIFAAGMILRRH